MKKSLQEFIIGSAIFLAIDRVVRVVSNQVVAKGQDESQRVSLRIETFVLILVVMIAWKVFR
jgi:hypothetical protein